MNKVRAPAPTTDLYLVADLSFYPYPRLKLGLAYRAGVREAPSIVWDNATELDEALRLLIAQVRPWRYVLRGSALTDALGEIINLTEAVIRSSEVVPLGRALQFADQDWVITEYGLQSLGRQHTFRPDQLKKRVTPLGSLKLLWWRIVSRHRVPSRAAVSEALESLHSM